MNFESPKIPTINDAMAALAQLEAKWTAEGNIDSERNELNNIRMLLERGDITPVEAITRATSIDQGRIQR